MSVKKKKWIAALVLLLVVCLIYLTMTPVGALRRTMLQKGYITQAFHLEFLEEPYPMQLEENEIGYSLANPPMEVPTQSDLINWVVVKNGLFYEAFYYGWG